MVNYIFYFWKSGEQYCNMYYLVRYRYSINYCLYIIIKGIHSMLKNIHEELIANRMMNERLWNKMNSLKDDLKKLTSEIVPTVGFSNDFEDQLFVEQFPFSTIESVVECEKILQIDGSVKEKLVCLFDNIIYYLFLKLYLTY